MRLLGKWQPFGRFKRITLLSLVAIGTATIWAFSHFTEAAAPLTLKFQNYEISDIGSEPLAVLWLTNSSARQFEHVIAGAISSNGTEIVRCEVAEKTERGWTNFYAPKIGATYTVFYLPAHSGTRVAVPLSKQGRPRKVAVPCYASRRRLTGVLAEARRLWWRIIPPKVEVATAWCEEELRHPNEGW